MMIKMGIFGDVPIGARHFFEQLFAEVSEKLNKDSLADRTLRTKAFTASLCDIGQKLTGLVHGKGTANREWLLDAVCLDRSSLAIKFAAESEFSKSEAHRLDDFEKLLSTKAPLKIFLFWTEDHKKESAVSLGQLQKYMNNFDQHVEGEQYLILEVNPTEMFSYVFNVPSHGKVSMAAFTPLSSKRWSWVVGASAR